MRLNRMQIGDDKAKQMVTNKGKQNTKITLIIRFLLEQSSELMPIFDIKKRSKPIVRVSREQLIW